MLARQLVTISNKSEYKNHYDKMQMKDSEQTLPLPTETVSQFLLQISFFLLEKKQHKKTNF